MKEWREEIRMKEHINRKLLGSRMSWAGLVHRTGEDRRSTRAWQADDGGGRRRV